MMTEVLGKKNFFRKPFLRELRAAKVRGIVDGAWRIDNIYIM